MQLTPDWASPLHLVWSPDTHIVNKRKKHILQIKKHINYLHDFLRQFVLVPADKAANNVIVVCKKYYLDVLNELSTTDTYMCKTTEVANV